MKRQPILISVLTLGLILALAAGLSLAQGPGPQGNVGIQATPVGTFASAPLSTSFTYQGRLTDGGSPADGNYDFEFKLYDAESNGGQVGEPNPKPDVAVQDGYFTVELDFGDVFDGTALWLEVGVRTGDSDGAFTVLGPRQKLTATPYALHARDAWSLTGNEIQSGHFLGTTNAQPLVIKTNDEEAMRIDAAGNVGIGTAIPFAKLEVNGNLLLTGGDDRTISVSEPDAADQDGRALNVEAGDAWLAGGTGRGGDMNVRAGQGGSYWCGGGVGGGGDAHFGAGSGGLGEYMLGAGGFGGTVYVTGGRGGSGGWGGDGGDAHFKAGAGGSGNYMIPGSCGDGGTVYITGGKGGTAGDESGSDGNVILAHSGAEPIGNVGIGTTSPGDYKLDVNGKVRASNIMYDATLADGSGVYGHHFNDAGPVTITGYLAGTDPVRAGVYGAYNSTIPGWAGYFDGQGYFSGNVGIGTPNPGSKLTVDGVIESANGGIKFPDGSIQTTAAGPSAAWLLNGNSGTNPATNFLGTTDEVSLTLRVSDTIALRLEPTSGTPNLIGGYSGNSTTSGVKGGIIGGGGFSGAANRVTDDYATIGGGARNLAGDDDDNVGSAGYATVGGGDSNTASASYATVGGGTYNRASDWAATVCGGMDNLASGTSATVCGGWHNSAREGATVSGGASNGAIGGSATVGGGIWNTASGDYATVGGGFSNTASGPGATVGGGEYISVSGQAGTVAGGSWITATGAYAAVGGGYHNEASGGGTTIGGGQKNTASADRSTVAGGYTNTASDFNATVGGGYGNTASSASATVGGGWMNTASDMAATIGGGSLNYATGHAAAVGGGEHNTASGEYATVPGGSWNTAKGDYSFAAGRRAKANHDGTFVWADSTDADFESTGPDQFLVRASGGVTLTVGSGGLRIEPTSPSESGWSPLSPNLIGGFSGNRVAPEVVGATISGGGTATDINGFPAPNRVMSAFGTVGGGYKNTASGSGSVVGGGHSNTAEGFFSTVVGGEANIASGFDSTVCGGAGNTASGGLSAVGGGSGNMASGSGSMIPGGGNNTAAGDYSFAAGRGANANHDGAFVWADSTFADIASTSNDQFIVRASGGIWFGTTSSPSIPSDRFINTSTGAYLSNGGTWTNASDRDTKENFASVDGQEMLKRLAATPITTWNYKAEDPSIRHMGPMAQDFYATFDLGESERHISTVDADGVALAAIQGLYQLLQEKDAQMAAQQQRIDDLEARVAALEQAAGTPRSSQTNLPGGWLVLGGLVVAIGVVVRRQHPGGGQ